MNIVVAQSGGPTSVINASLLGVFRQALAEKEIDTVFGSLNGIEGIIHDRLVSLNDQLVTEEDMALLRQTPSSALRSCRYKLPSADKEPAVYETIRRTLESTISVHSSTSAATIRWIRCINCRHTLLRSVVRFV